MKKKKIQLKKDHNRGEGRLTENTPIFPFSL